MTHRSCRRASSASRARSWGSATPPVGLCGRLRISRRVRGVIRSAIAFAPRVEAIAERITPRTRLLILNLPHNPTGGVAEPQDLARLAELARRHDLWVISDEVYGQIRYDGSRDSIAALPGMAERTVIVDGFSKGYSMTGWRLGYGIMPARLAEPMTTLVINNVSCTATFVQHAGLAALTGSQEPVTRMVSGLRAKRDLLVRGLNAIDGVSCA